MYDDLAEWLKWLTRRLHLVSALETTGVFTTSSTTNCQGVAKTGHPDAIKYLSGTYNVGAIVRCHSRVPFFIKLPFIQHEFKLLSNVGTCVVFRELLCFKDVVLKLKLIVHIVDG